MFSQDLHDASEQELNSTNLFPVTKDFAEAFSEACQHCASNRYTCTRTIFASNEKFDDDENHAYQDSNVAGFGQAHLGLAVSCIIISVKEIMVTCRTCTHRFEFLAVRAWFAMITR